MNKLYRILVIRFDYLTAQCLFPIILNWQEIDKATYEMEIIDKIIAELNSVVGITKVRTVHNRVGTYEDLQKEFDEIIGNINYNTPQSQLKTLSVSAKTFIPLSPEQMQREPQGRFIFNTVHFPVRVNDPKTLTLSVLTELPMLVIEQ